MASASGKAGIFAADEWARHGSIIPGCLLGVMLVGVHGYTLGVMIRPLEQEFGWSRAEISAATLAPSLCAILLAPFAGMAIDRWGPRRIALIGVPLFCGALAALSLATANIASWWLLYGLLGLTAIMVMPTVWTAAINARFDRNRGLALAIALTGTGIGAALMPITATWLLQAYGWRGAYIGIGLLILLVAYPPIWLLFDRDGARVATDAQAANPAKGTSTARAPFADPRYVKLAAAALIYSTANCILTINAVPILLSEGFDAITAAEIAGVIGIGTILGRLLGGVLLDKFDGRFVAASSGLAPITGAVLLLTTQDSHAAALFACLLFGISGGTEYDACAYLTARYFGMRNFGSLFGLVGGLSLFGAGAAPTLASLVYDRTGAYDLVLWAMMPVFVLAGLLFIGLGPYPDRASLDD